MVRAMPWAVAIESPSGYIEPIISHFKGLFSIAYLFRAVSKAKLIKVEGDCLETF
jgi:hypothetical protein